jgi:membrane protein insertase Oxa1/YidC/SpoIIIJ
VLIVLAIGLMVVQQLIMMRSQKDANELSSVDGSAATTNKWMMIMMPLIYGIFSFFYSAAFSIYMITNTCYSLITTLIINKAMDVSFAKKEENEELQTNAKHVTNNRKRLK